MGLLYEMVVKKKQSIKQMNASRRSEREEREESIIIHKAEHGKEQKK